MKTRFYRIDEKLTLCSTGADNTWKCFKNNQPISAPDPEQTKKQYANVNLPYMGVRTYAGQLSKCFTYSGGEFCYNDAGALMYMKLSGSKKHSDNCNDNTDLFHSGHLFSKTLLAFIDLDFIYTT